MVLGSNKSGFRVKELIELLRCCPDQNAWVVLPDPPEDEWKYYPFGIATEVEAVGDFVSIESGHVGGGRF
jgi:hypothetical protein